MVPTQDDEERKKDFQVLYDRKSVDPIGIAVGSMMYEFEGFNVPKVHLPKHINNFQSTNTNLGSLAPSSRKGLLFSPEAIKAAMLTLSEGYCPDTSYLWTDALKVLLTLTTDSLRFTIAKQFIANSLKLGEDKFLSIPDDMIIISSNWNFISKQIWRAMYPITLTDSRYSGGPISKTEAYNMISLLSGDSEKAMTKPDDDEDRWANKKRSNRKNQLSSAVEETTDLAVGASSFMLESQNLYIDLVFATGWADKIHGLTIPADGSYHVQALHEPIGVAGQIIPWKFTLLMSSGKVGRALACSNSTVLKTAENSLLSALYAGNQFLEEDFSPRVFLNVISGFGPTARAALCSHMDVDKLAFTGSIATGKTVLALTAASNTKSVTLDLGGKSLFIVCEDPDVDKAVELLYFALFYNQGRCCYVGSQTSVHERTCDEFLQKRAVKHLVGDQINNEQFSKIFKNMKSDAGTGGRRLGSKGFHVQMTVFSGVQDMLIAQDKIFGPVQSISKFRDATSFGLAAGVFTHNIDAAQTLARALKAGAVNVNCFDVFDAAMPFGGYKESH